MSKNQMNKTKSDPKNRKKIIGVLILLIGIALLIFINAEFFFSVGRIISENIIETITVLFLVIGGGTLMFYYLEKYPEAFIEVASTSAGTIFNKTRIDKITDIIRKVSQEELQDKLIDSTSGGNKVSFEKFTSKLKEDLYEEISNDFQEDVLNKLSTDTLWHRYNKSLESNVASMESRLENQIYKLSRNSTINLMIGVLTTSVAIYILGDIIFTDKSELEKLLTGVNNPLIYYIPRVSLALFIEVFSFFFLRLYKKNLEDIKYFQNERTNVDFKVIALNTAIQNRDNSLLLEVVKHLATTERNFILKKDESTIGLKYSEMDTANDSRMFNFLEKVLEKIK